MPTNEEIYLASTELENMRAGWLIRKQEIGLNKIDPKTGRFVKQCLLPKKNT
jgi:hypothetical protein